MSRRSPPFVQVSGIILDGWVFGSSVQDFGRFLGRQGGFNKKACSFFFFVHVFEYFLTQISLFRE
jgi:hypothetical protein